MTTPQTEVLREAIARIVDAGAWSTNFMSMTDEECLDLPYRKHVALERADRVIALLTSDREASQRRIGELEKAMTRIADTSKQSLGPERKYDICDPRGAAWADGYNACMDDTAVIARAALNNGDAG